MSYINSALLPNEHLILKAKIHWIIYVSALIILAIGLILCFRGGGSGLEVIGFILSVIGIAKLLKAWLYCYSTELAITSTRIIAKYGFIRRNTIELKHDKMESLNVDQGIIGRILNYGSVSVIGTGGSRAPIPYIANPLQFKKKALEISEK